MMSFWNMPVPLAGDVDRLHKQWEERERRETTRLKNRIEKNFKDEDVEFPKAQRAMSFFMVRPLVCYRSLGQNFRVFLGEVGVHVTEEQMDGASKDDIRGWYSKAEQALTKEKCARFETHTVMSSPSSNL